MVEEYEDDAPEIVETLMDTYGLSFEVVESPLCLAIERENLELVSFFVKRGADV